MQVRAKCGYTARYPVWLIGDATCENKYIHSSYTFKLIYICRPFIHFGRLLTLTGITENTTEVDASNTPAHCLRLPGKKLLIAF